MKLRRWPDVVIVVAIAALAAWGGWALWGEDLGLRGGDRQDPPGPGSVGRAPPTA